MEGIARTQKMAAASLPMERMAEYLVQQMEAGGKQLHHAGMTQHAALHTLGSTVCVHSMQDHGVRDAWRCNYLTTPLAQHGEPEIMVSITWGLPT